MTHKRIALCSVSWIDGRALPPVGFWFISGALLSWPRRVLIGLVGTANPPPPNELGSVAAFRGHRQYRALASCSVGGRPGGSVSDIVLDPGWTPPLDKSRFDPGLLAQFAADQALPDDPAFHAGESSALSAVVAGRLHPASTLASRAGDQVLAGMLIKFRAGAHTNRIGVEEAKSPVHVPWVWCETALVRRGNALRLLGSGSCFPSHRWYVNGRCVGERLQKAVSVSENDPVLSTGQPKGEIRSRAETDRGDGAVSSHDHAVAAGPVLEVGLPADLLD